MSPRNASGTILIRENTVLPAGLALESEAFLPGWRIVRDIDVYGLGRKIEEAHWNFFYLAGAIKTIVFGNEKSGSLRTAVRPDPCETGGSEMERPRNHGSHCETLSRDSVFECGSQLPTHTGKPLSEPWKGGGRENTCRGYTRD